MYKKFGRFAVLGLVLVIIGSVTLCAFYFGGYDFNRINSSFNSRARSFFIDSRNNTITREMTVVQEYSDEEYTINGPIEETTININGNSEDFYTSDSEIAFNYIELNVAAASFTVVSGESFSIQADNIKQEYFEYSLDNNKLFIKYIPKINFSLFSFNSGVIETGDIYITVPEKLYENVKIHVTGGDLNVENLDSEVLDFELTAGSASINNVDALSSARIYMTAGDLGFYQSSFGSTDFEMTAGTCMFNDSKITDVSSFSLTAGELDLYSCTLNGDIEVDMTAGSVYMDLLNDINDYKINRNRTAGTINIASNSGKNENSNSDSLYNFNIKTTAGSCDVNFK